jgi:hypothetical protein
MKILRSYFSLLLTLSFLSITACTDSLEISAVVEPTTVTYEESSPTDTDQPTQTLSSTIEPPKTDYLSKTNLPTLTSSPTVTVTPIYEYPSVVVNVQAAHCRYGPSKAYLHAADLYMGDVGVVDGRFLYSDWLFVKWEKLHYHCWVSPYVVDVTGDISQLGYVDVQLWRIPSTLYQPPTNVQASRQGDLVTITWDSVWMTEDDDRGYLIEAWVCQDGAFIWWTASFENQYITSYSVKDDNTCNSTSSGVIYTVEKHGYTEPAVIPWPPYE